MSERIKRDFDYPNRKVTLTYPEPFDGDGHTQLIFDLNNLTPTVLDKAALLGLVTKVTKVKEPLEAVKQIGQGIWPERAVAVKIPLAVEALHRLTQQPLAVVLDKWEGVWDKTKKAEIQKDERVAALMKQIKQEQEEGKEAAGQQVDMDSLFQASPPAPVPVV